MALRLLDLPDEILRVGDARRGGVGDPMGRQGLDDVLLAHLLPVLARGGRRPGPVGRRGAALDARVHVGFVVVADVDEVLVSLHGARERLEADVEGAAVAGPGDDRRFRVALHVQGGPHAAGRGPARLEGGVDDGDLQRRRRVGPGDDGPAAGRHDHHHLLAEGLQHKPHGDGGAAARAADVAGIHEFLFGQFNFHGGPPAARSRCSPSRGQRFFSFSSRSLPGLPASHPGRRSRRCSRRRAGGPVRCTGRHGPPGRRCRWPRRRSSGR